MLRHRQGQAWSASELVVKILAKWQSLSPLEYSTALNSVVSDLSSERVYDEIPIMDTRTSALTALMLLRHEDGGDAGINALRLVVDRLASNVRVAARTAYFTGGYDRFAPAPVEVQALALRALITYGVILNQRFFLTGLSANSTHNTRAFTS